MKSILPLFILIILAASVAAADFSATLTTGKSDIYPDEVAYYTVSVTNLQNISDLFTFSTPDFDWILDTPEIPGEVAPGETENVIIEITPKTGIVSGARVIRIKVRSANTNNFNLLNAFISVRSTDGMNRSYMPSIFLNAQVPAQVDPRDSLTFGIYLRNRNARNYDKLGVSIQSDLFTKAYTTTLGPIGEEGEKTNEVTIPLNANTPPGSHPLTITLTVDNMTVNEYKTQYVIKAYTGLTTTKTATTSFFKTTILYTIVNNGNTKDTDTIIHSSNFLKRLFTTASAQYETQSATKGTALAFAVSLDPQQQAEVSVTENYRLLFILIVIVILSVISYYLFRSPIVLRKEAVIVGSSTDGVSEMKMRVFIKNRSAKSIMNIHLIDKVTSMADVVKESSLGTLQPSKVLKKKGHGTLVRWDMDVLEAYEERIITYRVKTELKLIGDVYLPAAKARFEQAGKERTSYSNEVNIPREA